MSILTGVLMTLVPIGALTVTLTVYALFRGWIGIAACMAGGIVWWTAGSVAPDARLAGGSFLPVWLLLLSLGGFAYRLWVGDERAEKRGGMAGRS